MKPRNALITATAAAATMVGASAAMALNAGVLNTGTNDGVGNLTPTIVYVGDSPNMADTPQSAKFTVTDRPTITTSTASGVEDSDDDHDDRKHPDRDHDDKDEKDHKEHKDHSKDDDDHDDDHHHKYEGSDQDD